MFGRVTSICKSRQTVTLIIVPLPSLFVVKEVGALEEPGLELERELESEGEEV